MLPSFVFVGIFPLFVVAMLPSLLQRRRCRDVAVARRHVFGLRSSIVVVVFGMDFESFLMKLRYLLPQS
jgi:hypothetical protein